MGTLNGEVVQRKFMSLSGGEKQRFERVGGKPQQGFSVAQGRATEKAVSLAVRDPMEVELRAARKGWNHHRTLRGLRSPWEPA